MLEEVKSKVEEKFGFECEEYDKNILLIKADRAKIEEVMKFLKNEKFNYPHTITVVDYTPKGSGFQVNYIIENIFDKKFVMVRVELPADDLTISTVSHIFPQLQPHEREAWEMFGVEFVGNPRLEVMILPEWAKGLFPLRKSYTLKKYLKKE
jgi:NADH-quinone oxidoreductase subunit C